MPATKALINAHTGRMSVIGKSISPYVMEIESTPVSGVEIRKLVTAPLEAPLSFKEAATGNTPQLHKGRGIPITEAHRTEVEDFLANNR